MKRLTKQNVDASDLKHFRKYVGGLKHKQYQIVAVEGTLSSEEKAARLQTSKVFQAERIPWRKLSNLKLCNKVPKGIFQLTPLMDPLLFCFQSLSDTGVTRLLDKCIFIL